MQADDELERLKARLSRLYVGTSGIHAVGLSRATGTITIYVGPEDAETLDETLKSIRRIVDPFGIAVVHSPPAKTTPE